MTVPTQTRKQLRQAALKEIYRKHDIVVSNTTSTGSATTLNDTKLSPAADSEDFVGAYIYISSSTTSSPAVGSVARVTNVDFSAGTSQLTLLPAFSASVQSGIEYEIHYDLHPSKMNELLDEIMDENLHPVFLPASMVPDGDMRTSGVGNWTDSNAASTKSTSYTYLSSQSLQITASAANGYSQSDTMTLKPNANVLVDALCYITPGDSAKLSLYDVDNSATIDTAESAASGWVRFQFNASIPATCEQQAVRLISVGNTDVIYWDYVIVWPVDKFDIELPTTVEYGSEIDQVVYFELGRGLSETTDDNAYVNKGAAPLFYAQHADNFDPTRPSGSLGASNPYRLQVLETGLNITQPLFLKAWVDYDTFSSDTSSTTLNKDIVKHLLVAEMYDVLSERADDAEKPQLAERYSLRALDKRQEVGEMLRDEGPQPKGIIQGAFREPRGQRATTFRRR